MAFGDLPERLMEETITEFASVWLMAVNLCPCFSSTLEPKGFYRDHLQPPQLFQPALTSLTD